MTFSWAHSHFHQHVTPWEYCSPDCSEQEHLVVWKDLDTHSQLPGQLTCWHLGPQISWRGEPGPRSVAQSHGLKGSRCWELVSLDTSGKCWTPGPACIVLKWSDCCPQRQFFSCLSYKKRPSGRTESLCGSEKVFSPRQLPNPMGPNGRIGAFAPGLLIIFHSL